MLSKGQDKRPFSFANSQARRDINLAKENYHPLTHILPIYLYQRATTYQYQYAWTMD